MTSSLPIRAAELARASAGQLRQGLVEVLTARDSAPEPNSRAGRVAIAVSGWLGRALLILVALVIAINLLRTHGAVVSHDVSGGSMAFDGGRLKSAEDLAALSLLVLSVRSPLLAWRIGYLSVVFLPYITDEPGLGVPLVAALLVTYLAASLRYGRPIAWAMCVLTLVPIWLWVHQPVWATAVVLVVAIALDATTASRRAGHALEAQAAKSELDKAQRAVLEERTRIAREMHDIVAHHMSMIAVQAETASYRLEQLSPAATAEFASLSGAAREALTDLRRLLGVLRSDAPAEREPQPQLADVAALVETTRRAGVAVELSMASTAPVDVSPAVGLCAYRIVQEAISNAGRHAPSARVVVTVTHDTGELRLDVVNDPAGTSEGVATGGGRPGHGISGMRERVTLLGGTITAGPRDDGGFSVSATLPLPGSPERL